jgi:hypothetical protein
MRIVKFTDMSVQMTAAYATSVVAPKFAAPTMAPPTATTTPPRYSMPLEVCCSRRGRKQASVMHSLIVPGAATP